MDEQSIHQLERYFDGALSADEQRDFETRIASDPVMQEAVHQQRKIDSALRRLVPAPVALPVAISTLVEPAETVGRISPSSVSPWLRRLAIAAVICAGLFGAWSTWQHLKPADDGRVARGQACLRAEDDGHDLRRGP